jgi:hypothetical protein
MIYKNCTFLDNCSLFSTITDLLFAYSQKWNTPRFRKTTLIGFGE